MTRLAAGITLIALCVLAFLVYSNQGLRQERETLRSDNKRLAGQIEWQNKMQIAVASIEENRSRELTNAKNKIDDLQRDVDDGRRRLRLHASCSSAGPSGMADAAAARLTDAAQRDYFTLRTRIETANIQIAGLQDYIRDICLAQP
ncbi:lysis protein [Serratia symbiotica]|uniref:lysis protein n=1 Tax=Serratia symbiotica TaxID=138074 RepID=UPI0021F2A14D|nr:lysis protein [Serratia symbiotica]